MLKTLPPDGKKFDNFKCGEIYCLQSSAYNVACCLCGTKVEFGAFPRHFDEEHLPHLGQGNQVAVGDNGRKRWVQLLPVKSEDPIKHEDDWRPLEDEKPIDFVELQLAQMAPLEAVDVASLAPRTRTKARRKATLDQEANAPKDEPTSDANLGAGSDAELIDMEGEDPDWQDEEDIVKTIKCAEDDGEEDEDEEKPATAEEFRPFACGECERTYKSKRGLQCHTRTSHNPAGVKKSKKSRQDQPTELKCDECGESFRTERNLNVHRLKHTGIFCDICGKPFTQHGNMLRHRVRHTGVKDFQCRECEGRFYTDKELNAHMMRHTGILPHICEICGRRCRDRGVLTAHMRRHTGERPAKCDVCGKSFFSGYDLNVHAVTHSSERPFKCDVCGSTFQRKKALRVHKKLHTTERNHRCKICGKGFAQSSGLNSHMRSHDAALRRDSVPGATDGVALLRREGGGCDANTENGPPMDVAAVGEPSAVIGFIHPWKLAL